MMATPSAGAFAGYSLKRSLTNVNGVDPALVRRMERYAATAGLVSVIAASVVLVGWIFNIAILKSLVPGLATMKVNTALSLLLCGGALLIKARVQQKTVRDRLADGLALGVAVVTALTLLEYIGHLDLRLDQIFTRRVAPSAANPFPGRMSAATAECLLCVSLAIALVDYATRVSQALASVTLVMSLLALLGYVYGINALYRVQMFSSMALHTAVCLFILAVGHFMVRPRRCIHPLMVRDTQGGALARRLLPLIVLVPLVVGWLRLRGEKAGWYDTEFGIALFAMATILIFGLIVWWNASLLDRSDRARRRIEADRDDLLIREQAARQHAEKAVMARDQLLSVVSHELRTPLTPALLILTSLASRRDLEPDVNDDLQMVIEQVQIEARLVSDLLDLVGLSQARVTLKPIALDLNEQVRKIVASFRPQFAEKEVELKVDLDARLVQMNGDDRRLQQVFRNLFDNALKFTPERGNVKIRSFDTESKQFCLQVSDSGVGIEAEAMPRLFAAFERSDTSTTRRFGGLGIGLAISRMLVELHGGTLVAESKGVDQGTTLTLTLLASEAEKIAQPATAAATIPAASAKLCILLVEDNEDTLKVLARLLKAHGYNAVTAISARQALEILDARTVDLLISDIGLPDVSGWELMRTLRQRYSTPGIALSGFVSDEDQQRSRDCGYIAHLSKPIELPRLLEAVRAATQHILASKAG